MLHLRTHPVPVEGCFGCKAATVRVAPTATGSPEARAHSRVEAGWERDMPAYKRLRRQGLQPPRIDGSAERESRAETRIDVEATTPSWEWRKRLEKIDPKKGLPTTVMLDTSPAPADLSERL